MTMKSWKSILWAMAATLLLAVQPADAAMVPDPENTLIMELPWGKVVIEMRPDLAPKHVERIKDLVRKNFYNNTPFHRVMKDFMAQGGDPTGTGTGGSGEKLPAEFTGDPFVRGVVGMARSPASINSADSQFFIMLGSAPSLDGRYTIWGQVIEGMENVDKITKGDSDNNGMVSKPDRIVRMRVAADAK
jgi:peptidylprolyl isomerase